MRGKITWGRVFRIGFVVIACVSLLVNAVLLGVGISLSKRGVFDPAAGQALMDVPRDVRRAYVRDLAANREELRALRDDLRAKRRAVIEAAAAIPVDPAAMEAAMADVRAATTRMQTALHATMLTTAVRLSSED